MDEARIERLRADHQAALMKALGALELISPRMLELKEVVGSYTGEQKAQMLNDMKILKTVIELCEGELPADLATARESDSDTVLWDAYSSWVMTAMVDIRIALTGTEWIKEFED